MLCPRCLTDIPAFDLHKDPHGKQSYVCPSCAKNNIPLRYTDNYLEYPVLPFSVVGSTAHGKSQYLRALHRELDRVGGLWPGFVRDDLDVAAFKRLMEQEHEFTEGVAPEATQDEGDFTDPQIVRLERVPRVGGCQLAVFDTAGEVFHDPTKLGKSGKYVKNSGAVVWLGSLREPDDAGGFKDVSEKLFIEIITAYAEAMRQMGGQAKQQGLIFTLTKAERLVDRPGFPASARQVLASDLADFAAGDPWATLEQVSQDLRAWLLGPARYHNLVNRLDSLFRTVRFCAVSAQGQESTTPSAGFTPKAVLAPLFWLWRIDRPGVWVETAGRRAFFLSLDEAVRAAAAGGRLVLDPGEHRTAGGLELHRSVEVVGAGKDQT